MHVLQALAEQDRPLSALVAGHSRYVSSGEINPRVADVGTTMARVRAWAEEQGAVADTLDGLTTVREGEPMWWLSLRTSNTEPLLRLNVESNHGGTMERIRDQALSLARQV